MQNVLNEADENEKWIAACQSYYDNCKRKVTIEPDGVEIKWYTSREEPYTGSDGQTHYKKTEDIYGHIEYSYTKSGYLPLHNHLNEKGKEDVSVGKVCYLWASVVQEALQEKMPQCQFNDRIKQDGLYDASFTYQVPRPSWKRWF